MSSSTDDADGAPRRRPHRRVTRPGAPGTDPAPQAAQPPTLAAEDTPHSWGDGGDANDERLRRDKPPHWG